MGNNIVIKELDYTLGYLLSHHNGISIAPNPDLGHPASKPAIVIPAPISVEISVG